MHADDAERRLHERRAAPGAQRRDRAEPAIGQRCRAVVRQPVQTADGRQQLREQRLAARLPGLGGEQVGERVELVEHGHRRAAQVTRAVRAERPAPTAAARRRRDRLRSCRRTVPGEPGAALDEFASDSDVNSSSVPRLEALDLRLPRAAGPRRRGRAAARTGRSRRAPRAPRPRADRAPVRQRRRAQDPAAGCTRRACSGATANARSRQPSRYGSNAPSSRGGRRAVAPGAARGRRARPAARARGDRGEPGAGVAQRQPGPGGEVRVRRRAVAAQVAARELRQRRVAVRRRLRRARASRGRREREALPAVAHRSEHDSPPAAASASRCGRIWPSVRIPAAASRSPSAARGSGPSSASARTITGRAALGVAAELRRAAAGWSPRSAAP